jgi:hypothetical protein
MIRIDITQAAFDAIARPMLFGSPDADDALVEPLSMPGRAFLT